jgi:aspartate aminotransferase
MIRLADAMPVIVPAVIDQGFRVDLDLLQQAISPRTKALIVNSPGNPSGNVLTRKEMDGIADLVEETGMFVLSDEIYEKILYDGCTHMSIGSWKSISDRVVSINGLSKAYAMTGWRIGYLGGPADLVRAAAKVQSQVTSNPNSIAQKAAVAALTGNQDEIVVMRNEFARRRDIALAYLGTIPEIRFVRPQGAFYILLGIANFLGRKRNEKRMSDSTDVANYLLNDWRVAVVPGIAFGVDSCIRLSFACSREELQQGLERIVAGLRSLER